MAAPNDNISMALYCDFENVALGVRDANYDRFDIKPVLERLLLKGSIVVKKAYCDWERYKEFKSQMHEASFELIEIPHVRQSGKNSADIRMVVDALDLCYTKAHVNTFVIISGDSDFSPLVSKLRENAKYVIGVGVKNSTSDLLVANCDEFIFIDDLVRESRRTAATREKRQTAPRRVADGQRPAKEDQDSRKSQAIDIAAETFDALMAERGDGGKIWASALKQAIKRRKPDFNETYFGFRTFGNLLEEAQSRGLFDIGRDDKSGAFVYRNHKNTEEVPALVQATIGAASPVAPVAAVSSTLPGQADAAAQDETPNAPNTPADGDDAADDALDTPPMFAPAASPAPAQPAAQAPMFAPAPPRQPNQNQNRPREPHRNGREARDVREPRPVREPREQREPRDNREARDARPPRPNNPVDKRPAGRPARKDMPDTQPLPKALQKQKPKSKPQPQFGAKIAFPSPLSASEAEFHAMQMAAEAEAKRLGRLDMLDDDLDLPPPPPRVPAPAPAMPVAASAPIAAAAQAAPDPDAPTAPGQDAATGAGAPAKPPRRNARTPRKTADSGAAQADASSAPAGDAASSPVPRGDAGKDGGDLFSGNNAARAAENGAPDGGGETAQAAPARKKPGRPRKTPVADTPSES